MEHRTDDHRLDDLTILIYDLLNSIFAELRSIIIICF